MKKFTLLFTIFNQVTLKQLYEITFLSILVLVELIIYTFEATCEMKEILHVRVVINI